MDFISFLSNESPDHLGRKLDDIWAMSYHQIEYTHDFIQLMFPTNKPSGITNREFYINNETLANTLRQNQTVCTNIKKSARWYLRFLSACDHWICKFNHNHLRITRVIECLHLLVSPIEAQTFYQNVLLLNKKPLCINSQSLKFWYKAANPEASNLCMTQHAAPTRAQKSAESPGTDNSPVHVFRESTQPKSNTRLSAGEEKRKI